MPESIDAFAELRAIRARVEGIEHRQEMLVRAHSEEILSAIWAEMDKDSTLAEVYLLVDGKRTQQGIMDALKGKGTPLSQPTVSRRLSKLSDELGLIDVTDRTAAGVKYRKSELDRILHLSARVERRLEQNRKASRRARRASSSG